VDHLKYFILAFSRQLTIFHRILTTGNKRPFDTRVDGGGRRLLFGRIRSAPVLIWKQIALDLRSFSRTMEMLS